MVVVCRECEHLYGSTGTQAVISVMVSYDVDRMIGVYINDNE